MPNDSQKLQQLQRVLLLYQLVKTKPEMSSKALQEELGIGKSTYNRDRDFMKKLGVYFEYDKQKNDRTSQRMHSCQFPT
jgi:predicted DNA-binding transcriptional regulator YafY